MSDGYILWMVIQTASDGLARGETVRILDLITNYVAKMIIIPKISVPLHIINDINMYFL